MDVAEDSPKLLTTMEDMFANASEVRLQTRRDGIRLAAISNLLIYGIDYIDNDDCIEPSILSMKCKCLFTSVHYCRTSNNVEVVLNPSCLPFLRKTQVDIRVLYFDNNLTPYSLTQYLVEKLPLAYLQTGLCSLDYFS